MKPIYRTLLLSLVACAFIFSGCRLRTHCADCGWYIESDEVVDMCAADFDIRYALYAKNDDIYIGYYDKRHHLKVARRDSSGRWAYAVLDEEVNWDSHRYISMVVDRDDVIHLSGNIHRDPLVYYRSEPGGNVATLKRDSMTGIFEESTTYPEFLQTDDMLVFHYRNGRSGDGSTYFNIYDYERCRWNKLHLEPLFDGAGESNSYFKGPVLGDDGRFHLIWCWRDEADCSTNHGLYYAYSEDLQEWHTPGGYSKQMPMTPADDEFLVDDIKIKEGLINGGFALGFDEWLNPVVGYHKYDENDHTNIYSALFEDGRWCVRRITDWKWKWEFSGRGSIPFELVFNDTWREGDNEYFYVSRLVEDGLFGKRIMKNYLVSYSEANGSVVEEMYSDYPCSLDRGQKSGLLVHKEFDRGDTWGNDSVRYLLRYETIEPNRDKKNRRWMRPSQLRLVRIRQ